MAKKTKTDPSIKDTLNLFMSASWKHRADFLLALLQPIGGVCMGVGVPFFASTLLAELALHGAQAEVKIPLILLASVSLVGVICNRIGFNRMMAMQAKTINDLNRKVFDHLLRRSVGFHADRISGKLVSDALDLSTSYATLTTSVGISGLNFVLNTLIGLTVILLSSWRLGLFVVVVVTVTLTWAGLESRKRAELRATRLIATKKLISHLSDSIVNAPTIKTFAQEKNEYHRSRELNHKLQDLRIRDWTRAGRSGNNRTAALLAMQFSMILYVIYLTRHNPAVLAAGIFAFTYTLNLANRLFEINNLTRQIEESFLQASPMVAILNEPIEIQDRPGAKNLSVKKGEIALENVNFSYQNASSKSLVFQDLSLLVRPGERVGLVGPSGGGKSTLTRLLLRFDDIDDGSIKIDGQNIKEVRQISLRSAIAYVPQEPLLFHRTILENIAYGKPNATKEEVIRAAKKANAHHFIESLANGYDTIVGERGVKLSGGQRQRVAIARAILKDAPILILDEATSALDSESEVLIQNALWELMKGRTAIVIAHRLSTIQRMDRIVVLEDGAITEQGSHKELLKHNGTYAKLWAHQSGGFIEE